MGVRISELLELVPADVGRRVNAARKRWNNVIREALRQETGLRLNRPDSEIAERQGRAAADGVTVPVRLAAGLPAALRELELTPDEAAAVWMAGWRPALEALRDGATGVEEMLATGRLPTADALVGERQANLVPARELAQDLLDILERHDPLQKVFAVEQDVLGAYRYPTGPQADLFNPDLTKVVSVELYWPVIGFVAPVLGVSVDALTVVVLAHELAHAYTHLGQDIDGHRWATAAFASGGHALIEGLAQYYTERVCQRIREQYPEALAAYKALFACQPEAYQTHCERGWNRVHEPEEVRLGLLETSCVQAARCTLAWEG